MQLRFGVSHAHANASGTLLDGARRLSSLLEQQLGVPVKAVTTDDYESLLQASLDGSVDIAWMPPLMHARAIEAGARLAGINQRHGAVTYRACLLARQDSEVRALGDVKKLRAAWTDRNSACGYLLPRMYLRASGVALQHAFVSERFYGSSEAACRAVATGEADICSTFVNEWAAHVEAQVMSEVVKVYPDAATQLRVLAVTTSIPSDGVTIGPHLAVELQTRIETALLELHTSTEGAAILKQLMNSDRLVRPDKNVALVIANLQRQLNASAIR